MIGHSRNLTVAGLALALGLITTPALRAQEPNVAFGGLKTDISQPVQVDADTLSVSQTDGSASFSGNVVIAQGDMRLTAQVVTIRYSDDKASIESLHAEGGVTLTAGTDSASSDTADYSPAVGEITLSGSVLLTQGQATMSGQKLVLNLKTGLGTMSGRVTTTFTPGGN
jgi:lipopolysaccharide export system protein LptA